MLSIYNNLGDPPSDLIGYTNYDYFAADSEFMRKTIIWI